MKLSDLIKNDEYVRLSGELSREVTGITTDPEYRGNANLLIIIKNGTNIGPKDLDARFSAIICDDGTFDALSLECECTLISVSSPRRALAMAESRIREIDYSRMKFVAVTGTNGKTTTARLVRAMLGAGGYKTAFIGTGAIEIGSTRLTDDFYSMTTPDPTLLYEAIKQMESAGVDYVVMEVSSHALFFEKVAPITFSCSIFTNISAEHLDFHKTLKDYTETKLKLLSSSELAIMNIDDPVLRSVYDGVGIRKKSFGILWGGDSHATDLIDRGFGGFKFIYRESSFSFLATSPLAGKFNLYNALGALSAAIALGVAPRIAKEALLRFSGVKGRIECVYDGKIKAIIDYAHSEEAFRALLSTARSYTKGRLIALFGCGGDRYSGKRSVMAKIAEKYADKVYVTADNPRKESPESIFSDIISGFSKESCYTLIPDRAEAIAAMIDDSKDGDTLLFIGKGAEEYNIDAEGYHRFDERGIILAAIKRKEDESDESQP